MRFLTSLVFGTGALVLVSLVSDGAAQVLCQGGLSLPAPALERDTSIYGTAADLRLAVRPYRIALVGGTWTYQGETVNLGEQYLYQGVCGSNVIRGGRYKDVENGACIGDWKADGLHTNSYFWNCATRPYHWGDRKIWAVHAVRAAGTDCAPGAQTVLQFYEISLNPTTVAVTRLALPDGDHAVDPSLAVNARGDVVITFNRSYVDITKYPGIWRWTRQYGGSFGNPTEEKAGPEVASRAIPYGDPQHWGVSPFWADFTGTEPDPAMDCQFWSHHLTGSTLATPPCSMASQKWQSWLLRFRITCPQFSIHENLDMDQDGDLTATDIILYQQMIDQADPAADRTYDGGTDAMDYVDFMQEWDDPE